MAEPGVRRWRLVRARRDAVPASVRRFNRRARQRRMRAAAPWAVTLGVLALVGLLAWVVLGTPLLGVRQVRVAGTDILSPGQVRDAAAIRPGTPLARLDLGAVRHRVAGLAPVAEVVVVRDWPGAVQITVVERTPVATVPKGRAFQLVDASGVVYHTVEQRPGGLAVIRLATPGPDDPTTRAALTVLGALTPQLQRLLVEVVADAPTRISLELRDNRRIIWGDATESGTKATVATALLGKPGTRIDVSAPEVATIR